MTITIICARRLSRKDYGNHFQLRLQGSHERLCDAVASARGAGLTIEKVAGKVSLSRTWVHESGQRRDKPTGAT